MNSNKERYYRALFAIAAVYDLVLGITFTFLPARTFAALGIAGQLPAFGGYLALLGAFVLVIGVAYALIALGDLQRNADLIFIGGLYKLAYASTAIYYWATSGLPHVIFGALFGVADAIFFILMAECYFFVKRRAKV
jgi:hypothetical protein